MNISKILIIQVLIFVYRVCYCHDILSKFHQTDYNIRNLRVDVTNLNKSLMHEFTSVGYKFNRTTTAFNVTFWPKIDLEDKVECLVQAFKRASNEYRLFPMRFQLNECKVIQSNVMGLQNIANYGNYSFCNWKKDTLYYINSFPIDERQLPPLIPTGEYKAQVDLLYDKNQLLGTLNMYAEVFRSEIKKH